MFKKRNHSVKTNIGHQTSGLEKEHVQMIFIKSNNNNKLIKKFNINKSLGKASTGGRTGVHRTSVLTLVHK